MIVNQVQVLGDYGMGDEMLPFQIERIYLFFTARSVLDVLEFSYIAQLKMNL